MATCSYCDQDMLEAPGCFQIPVQHKDGRKRPPIKHTGPKCHDCNALAGNYHHPGCDMERCPFCDGQLITCECQGE